MFFTDLNCHDNVGFDSLKIKSIELEKIGKKVCELTSTIQSENEKVSFF